MKYIQLQKGFKAIVDDEDFELVSKLHWHRDSKDYAVHTTSRKLGKQTKIRLHRFLLQAPKDQLVDHINGDPLDNCRSNLRFATTAQNIANSKRHLTNKSGFKGVCWHSRDKKWAAFIQGKHLGYFLTPIEAAKAYNKAAVLSFGRFARLNPL